MTNNKHGSFDKTNAIIAGFVYIGAFIAYAMTVQRSISFWDCGEFVACAHILGIPHPPGTPLFVLIGRLFSVIPFVHDIAYRVNFISVITSAATATFSYLLTVRLVGYFFPAGENKGINRYIAYIGGIAGAYFVAFSQTNWGNSVEAEVYGMALAMSVMLVWLTVIYFERRGTPTANKIMILFFYIALLGVGIHMTVFLVVPAMTLFFILKKDATARDWLAVSGFIIVELLMVPLFSDGRGGSGMFFLMSAILASALVILLYKKINWAVLIAIGSVSSVMIAFQTYIYVTPMALAVLVLLGIASEKYKWQFQWKTGIAIVLIAFIGISVHLYIPIRSALDPRIDENNPSRDFPTFVAFLDRKQYGQESMVDRMFHRRGTWENQFMWHPHMGYWSYFEEQYSNGGWIFLPFFALGALGMATSIKKRTEIGMPFLVLFLLCSAGLILYMNFADGTKYDPRTGDAYLEVRDRDYFFTPAFVFFGIAMGMGVSAIMKYLKEKFGGGIPSKQKTIAIATSVLALLPLVSLAHSYHINDRSHNFIPYNYAANLLDTCDKNALLFTSGDNDTFPLWCIQEVYNYRKDVTVINLSLLNTDWYVAQMKNQYHVPISLSDKQILWYPYEVSPGVWASRPKEQFYDRPRKRRTYLTPSPLGNSVVRVQDMMVDDIVIENKWEKPIYFSAPPYGDSPLNLRSRATSVGLLYRLDQNPPPSLVDVDTGYNLYMNDYRYGGYSNSKVYRDENATGVFIGVGVNSVRLYDQLIKQSDSARAIALSEKMMKVYPEYWQMYELRADIYDKQGDSAKGDSLFQTLIDTLSAFSKTNEENLFYKQDLGLAESELGRRTKDQALIDEGINQLWQAFAANPNSNYAFRKLLSVLSEQKQYTDIRKAALMFAEYGQNLGDPLLQQILNIKPPSGYLPPDE
jgi:hypothetical protein